MNKFNNHYCQHSKPKIFCSICNKDQTDVSHIDKGEINEPVALRYDFDGNGYLYMDAGSGSDWASRVKDCEFLYTHPQKESSTNIDFLERCIEQTQQIANLHQEIYLLKEALQDCTCQGGHSEAYLKAKGKL
jgi:hypothetical protein